MFKYTKEPFECNKCGKKNYFLVTVVTKNKKHFYLTQCPRCKTYDEVKQLTAAEYKKYQLEPKITR